ncbi:hypothetical protein BGT96224_Ac30225 [Blumeria graminis f. sp. tritici 96224]|nr:hypothetical protein BGT96224_Ac30225 [Blumeria graminis f. sp. tritici 96224]
MPEYNPKMEKKLRQKHGHHDAVKKFLSARELNTATPAPPTKQVTDEAAAPTKKEPEKKTLCTTVDQKVTNLPTPAVPLMGRNTNRKRKPYILLGTLQGRQSYIFASWPRTPMAKAIASND